MSDSCICVEPDGHCDFESRTTHRTRKPRRCGECRELILPGQQYERAVSVYEGQFYADITCMSCVKVRNDYFKCGWYAGEIWAWIHSQICEQEEDGFCLCPPRAPKTSWNI